MLYMFEELKSEQEWQDAFHRMYAAICSRLRGEASRLGVDWDEPDADEQYTISEAIRSLLGPKPTAAPEADTFLLGEPDPEQDGSPASGQYWGLY